MPWILKALRASAMRLRAAFVSPLMRPNLNPLATAVVMMAVMVVGMGGGGDGDGDGEGGEDGDGDGENRGLPENPTYPGDIPMPYADPAIPGSYTGQLASGVGGGTCPSASTISVSVCGYSASVIFEFTPPCDLSHYIRGMVIAFASIVGAYIVPGLRR
ncbi:virulence factor TspB C-terminal domain-related protein [Stenotrophomonas lactitubi]|uniref:virulence factor TspB C-terminal domain-related protein n=1 Tax=Stenotrophomonas lactitubi TaxID=2045214 RepID=UPI00320B4514